MANVNKLARIVEAFLASHAIPLTVGARAQFSAALADGNIGLAAEIISAAVDAVDASALRSALREIVAAAAATQAPAVARAARSYFAPTTLRVAFDILNPNTVSFIRRYEMNLIQQISSPTRDGIRLIIEDGLKAGRNPNAVARQVRQIVGLTDHQAKWVTNFRKELETFHLRSTGGDYNLGAKISRTPGGLQAFPVDPETGLPKDMILHRRLRDFRYDKTLANTVASGKPLTPQQIDKMVEAYSRKLRAYRSRMIARTEARRAQEMGNYLMWRQAADDGLFPATLIRRYWITAKDERVRLTHRPIPGQNPAGVGLEEPFATPHGERMGPPLGPNCRCGVIYRVLEPGLDPAEWAPQ